MTKEQKDFEKMLAEKYDSAMANYTLEEFRKPVWVYISFADLDGWRGAVITKAKGPAHALLQVSELGINPGGDFMFHPLGEKYQGQPTEKRIGDKANKLLTLEECKEIFGVMYNRKGKVE